MMRSVFQGRFHGRHRCRQLGTRFSGRCRCREVLTRANAWTVRRDEKGDRCRGVAVSAGSTVMSTVKMFK